MSTTQKRRALSFEQYCSLRGWLEKEGEQKVTSSSYAGLAASAAQSLGFPVAASTVQSAVEALGWKKAKPPASAETRIAELERRVNALEELMGTMPSQPQPKEP